MPNATSQTCLSTRIARIGRAVDQGAWASGHALIHGLRQCGLRHGCPDGNACADAAELLMGDVRGMVRDQMMAASPQP